MSKPASTEFQAIKATIANARKEMETVAKKAFAELSTSVFEKFPTLQSFGWVQYTPYFNDGEECVFRTQTDYPTMTFLTEGEEEEFNTNYGNEPNDPKTPAGVREKVEAAITEFFGAFDDDDLKTMFGDHITVTVSRDGTTSTDEYEHD
jgi:hypothetical protein